MRVLNLLAAAFLILASIGIAGAVEPDEVLDDPVLEERARQLSAELRCLVCQNQSIDDSDAQLAKDLRVLVRERLVAGDSDSQVIDYVVGRYGEFVLLKPRFSMRNLLLWATPVIALFLGAFAFFTMARRRKAVTTAESAMLTPEENERITKILDERD
ncbi:MAG: cytochrome c-type biogenesis protein [Pseudomonadota bacterium]